MDTAVALVQAYLRVNGYFTVAEYPVLDATGPGGPRTITDLDILAVRLHRGVEHARAQRDEHAAHIETWRRQIASLDAELEVPEAGDRSFVAGLCTGTDPGTKADGRRFAAQAAQRGAACSQACANPGARTNPSTSTDTGLACRWKAVRRST